MKQKFVFLVIVTLPIVFGQAPSIGTQVDAVWYDRMALLYQNPEVRSSTDREAEFYSFSTKSRDLTSARYPYQYIPLNYQAFIGPSTDGKGGVVITSNPSFSEAFRQGLGLIDDSLCFLLGEAAFSERVIRNSVENLENVINNEGLKQAVIAIGKQDRVYLEYTDTTSVRPERLANAVAVVNGTRVPADNISSTRLDIEVGQNSTKYTSHLRAEFNLKRLSEASAIQTGKITFQHGWQKSDFCSFDLNKLP